MGYRWFPQAPGATRRTTTLSLLTKTTTLSLPTRVYQQTKIFTLLYAPINTAISELYIRYTQLFGEELIPVSVYTTDFDHETTVLGIKRREGAAFEEYAINEDIITLEVIHSMVGVRKMYSKFNTGSDLLNRCLERAQSKKFVLMERYVDGEDEKGQPRCYGPMLNMYEELYSFCVAAQDPAQESFFEWLDNAKRNYKRALQYIKEDLVLSSEPPRMESVRRFLDKMLVYRRCSEVSLS